MTFIPVTIKTNSLVAKRIINVLQLHGPKFLRI